MQDSTLKIAIIRLSSLGDIITSLVFMEVLRRYLQESGKKIEITFIVDSAFRAIVEHSLLIDNIIDLPLRSAKKDKKLIIKIFKTLRNLPKFDIVIDAQGLLKSAIVGSFIKKNQFVGFSKDSAREKIAAFFYQKTAEIPYNKHILKRQYELFRVAFLEICKMPKDFCLQMLDSRHLSIDSSLCAKNHIANILSPFREYKKILFISESSKKDKEYPLLAFFYLAMRIKREIKNAKIFLIWDKNEAKIRDFSQKDDIFYLLPHLNFDEIKALLSNMDLVIGGDTGITHCAWALKVPSITIYISTNIKRFRLDGERHFSHLLNLPKIDLLDDLLDNKKCDEKHDESTENSDLLQANIKDLMQSVKEALK